MPAQTPVFPRVATNSRPGDFLRVRSQFKVERESNRLKVMRRMLVATLFLIVFIGSVQADIFSTTSMLI